MNICLYCHAGFEGVSKFCCQSCELLYKWVQEGVTPVQAQAISISETWQKYQDPQVGSQFDISKDPKVRKFKFHVEGLQCSSCVHLLEDFPKFFEKVISSRINYSRAVLEVETTFNCGLGELCQIIQDLGYVPTPIKETADYEKAVKRENIAELKRIGVAGAVAANEMLFSIPLYAGLTGNLATAFKYIGFFIFLPLISYSATPFYKKAWASLLVRRINVDMMIVVALWGGFIASCASLYLGRDDIYFDSTASFIFLILLTRYLLRHHQAKFIKRDIFADMFTGELFEVREKQRTIFKTFNDVNSGDLVIIKKGQFIPFDGTLKTDSGAMDLSFLTGESYPQRHVAGEKVAAGSRLLDGECEVLCNTASGETELAKSLQKLEMLVSDKNKFQTLTDTISHRLTLVVFSLAGLFFFWTYSELGYEAFKRCLALITVACPCAVAFGTPLAHHLGMRYAFKRGFMIKSELVFEKLGEVKKVIFDKTGTLTSSDLKLIKTFPQQLGEAYKEIILGLERFSLHPIAVTLKKLWHDTRPKTLQLLAETAGTGVSGDYEGHHYRLSKSGDEQNPSLMQVDFCEDERTLAYLYFEENIHPEARQVIDRLYEHELAVMMLSGDKRTRVMEAAKRLGVRPSAVFSDQTSDSKLKVIEEQNPCMYVGDGLNDLPALGKAHVSFAIRGPFEATMQVSDIYAPNKDLSSVVEVFEIAKKVQQTVQGNLAFAIFYNAVGGSLALLGFINPLWAAILMPISSFVITTHTVWRLKS